MIRRKNALQIMCGSLLGLGILLILVSIGYLRYQQSILSFKTVPMAVVQPDERRSLPSMISVPSQQLTLPISEAKIVEGIWETSQTTVTHLDVSARPGEDGNIVLYGHNTRQIFGSLVTATPGEVVVVSASDGRQYTYEIETVKVVKPEEISAVLPTSYEKLTLYTCTGWLDSKRLIVEAKLKSSGMP